MRKKILLILTICCSTPVCFAAGVVNPYAKIVSIASLLAVPEKYDSKVVRVKGVSWFGFEHSLVCLGRDDIIYTNLHNCLKVGALIESVKLNKRDIMDNYNKVYVVIEGVFRKPPTDAMASRIYREDGSTEEVEFIGIPLGRIEQVSRIDIMPIINYHDNILGRMVSSCSRKPKETKGSYMNTSRAVKR